MIHTAKQMKDLIRNQSRKTGIPAQVLLRKFMMERFMERVSQSAYRDNFILKGGLLVSAFVGSELRSTMDIDTTLKGLNVTADHIRRVVAEISAVQLGDSVTFQINDIAPIMDEADYQGLRLSMSAMLDESVIPMKIDISTGDAITPAEIRYEYPLMFENRSISIMAYPIETVLAEKIETIISRSTANTRMRDFYDIYILTKTQAVDKATLRLALVATAKKRGSIALLDSAENTLFAISHDADMYKNWQQYAKKNPYVGSVSWEDVLLEVRRLCIRSGLVQEKQSIREQLKAAVSRKPAAPQRQKAHEELEL